MRSNVVTLVGNLGADPDHRQLDTGGEVTNLRVGCTERRQDRTTGEWVDGATSWWRVSCWRALAANTAASLRKGDRVVVTGTVRVQQWERDGRSGTSLEVVADAVGHDLTWGRSRFERVVRSTSLPLPEVPGAAGAAEAAPGAGDDLAHAYEDAEQDAVVEDGEEPATAREGALA